MQPDPDRPRLQVENLRDLFGGQLLHVVQHKNNAQLRGNPQDRLMQQVVLLGVEQIAFGTLGGILQQSSQFRLVGHQLIQREDVFGSRCSLAAHAPAAVSGDGVEPDRESLRVLNLGQVPQRTVEHLLHGVFCVFRMPADLHAEGIDRVLQQTDCLFDSFRSIAAQQFGSLNQFGSHRWGHSGSRPV